MIFRSSSKHTPPASARTGTTVTIEDLLQFKKRAEQPAPEFWTDFDRQLKERQRAAAILEKRPWWHSLPRLIIAIPAGATAALAIGFIVWRNAAPLTAPAPATLAEQTLPEAKPAPAALATNTPATTPAATQLPPPAKTTALASAEQHATAAEAAATQPVAPEHLETARTVFASIASLRNTLSENTTTTSGYFSTRLAAAKITSTAALFSTPVALGGDTIAPPYASSINSITTTSETQTTPSAYAPDETTDPRRERLLTYIDNTIPTAAAAADNPRVTRLRDRVTSRFDDKTLSDSISRVATTGDRLTIKF